MYDFFAANASRIGYEAYFNEREDYIQDSLYDPVQMPAASAMYQSLYKPPSNSGMVIEDTQQGTTTGTVQFSATCTANCTPAEILKGKVFTSNWRQCAADCANAPDGSFKRTTTTTAAATVRFTGRQIKWIGMKEPSSAIATVAIDGGTATDVDPYSSAASNGTAVLYTSPMLTQGNHTLVITMTTRRNTASTGTKSITFDRAEILS